MKTSKIRILINQYRLRGSFKSIELEKIASLLGRSKVKGGKEPTWINQKYPNLKPLSIPHHGGVDLNRFTARSILDQLEEDLEMIESLEIE